MVHQHLEAVHQATGHEEDMRRKMLPVEESIEENSMDLDAGHKETADGTGNR